MPRPADVRLALRSACCLLALSLAVGCGDDDHAPLDAGTDGGPRDAGVMPDSEVVPDPDAGPDAWVSPDPEDPPAALELEGDPASASASGTLGLDGDVDAFDVTLPERGPFVLYARADVTPSDGVSRTLVLAARDGETLVGDARAEDVAGAQTLALARRVDGGATIRVSIQTDAGEPGLAYALSIVVVPEADPFELPGPPRAIALAGSSSATAELGRVNHQDDVDAIAFDVMASAFPRLLRVTVTPLPGEPRFPAVPGDQVLRLSRAVSVSADACRTEPGICPRDAAADPEILAEVDAACGAGECLLARRVDRASEDERARFELVVQLPPAASTTRYLVALAASGAAVDVASRVDITLEDDTDDASRWLGTSEQPSLGTLAVDATGATYPAPPAGSQFELRGALGHGLGTRAGPLRGAGDYDAVPSDVDVFVLQIPSFPPDISGLAWAIAWDVAHGADGSAPADLEIDVTLCDGDAGGGSSCTEVARLASGAPITLAYDPDPAPAWFDDTASPSAWQPRWSRSDALGTTTTIAAAAQCSCLEPRFVRGGALRLAVRLGQRRTYERVDYVIRTAALAYPQSYLDASGTEQSCPAPCAYTER